ncbi:MAG: copper resistance CopC family protein [Pseudomonadota bacterium]
MRKLPPIFSLAALVLTIGACSARTAPDPTSAPVVTAAPLDLSVTSTPAAGSVVTGPVNVIALDFSAPVALGEVLVTGPDGKMPMMLSSAGQQRHFEIPLPGLTAGAYRVDWRASRNGIEQAGTFAFTVK